jgi:phosphohistidine phosphatase
MDLYFLRHGLAGEREEWKGDDFDRPLTEQGKERVEREAATIAELQLAFDLIVSSPLIRAYQTAEIVARKLEMQDRIVKDERLSPGFGPDHLAKILLAYPKADALLLVGHEPDFSETISHLIGGGRIILKKGGLAYVEVPEAATLKGELVWLIPPKVLAR